MHGSGRVPDDDVAARSGSAYTYHTEQAHDHARLDRHDRLQRVVGAKLQGP